MNNSLTFLTILWLLFGVSHSILAHSGIKSAALAIFGLSPISYRLFYNLFAFFFLTGLLYLQVATQDSLLIQQTIFSLLLALLFGIVGGLVMMLCVAKYFKQLSGIFREAATPNLETRGLHKYVRHPLYVGTILFVVGLVILFPYLKNVIAAVIVIGYTLVGAHFEERKLIKIFGEQYINYQQKVPMFLPRISAKQPRH